MENKSLYFIVTLATLMLGGGIFIFAGKELLSKMPLWSWILEIVLFLGWWYLMIFGMNVRPKWKQVVYGLALVILFLFLVLTYTLIKAIAPGSLPF